MRSYFFNFISGDAFGGNGFFLGTFFMNIFKTNKEFIIFVFTVLSSALVWSLHFSLYFEISLGIWEILIIFALAFVFAILVELFMISINKRKPNTIYECLANLDSHLYNSIFLFVKYFIITVVAIALILMFDISKITISEVSQALTISVIQLVFILPLRILYFEC